jgi:hypothetical protein
MRTAACTLQPASGRTATRAARGGLDCGLTGPVAEELRARSKLDPNVHQVLVQPAAAAAAVGGRGAAQGRAAAPGAAAPLGPGPGAQPPATPARHHAPCDIETPETLGATRFRLRSRG